MIIKRTSRSKRSYKTRSWILYCPRGERILLSTRCQITGSQCNQDNLVIQIKVLLSRRWCQAAPSNKWRKSQPSGQTRWIRLSSSTLETDSRKSSIRICTTKLGIIEGVPSWAKETIILYGFANFWRRRQKKNQQKTRKVIKNRMKRPSRRLILVPRLSHTTSKVHLYPDLK